MSAKRKPSDTANGSVVSKYVIFSPNFSGERVSIAVSNNSSGRFPDVCNENLGTQVLVGGEELREFAASRRDSLFDYLDCSPVWIKSNSPTVRISLPVWEI
jgi:hypothetical protein